jgi:hypothetical protein
MWSDGCNCTFDDECSGTGAVYCSPPCGGDLCICDCGGDRDCPGCEWCRPVEDGADDDRDDEPGWAEHWRDLGGEG